MLFSFMFQSSPAESQTLFCVGLVMGFVSEQCQDRQADLEWFVTTLLACCQQILLDVLLGVFSTISLMISLAVGRSGDRDSAPPS